MARTSPYPCHRKSLLRMLGLLPVLVLWSASLAKADTAPTLVVTDEGPGVVNPVGVTADIGGNCANVYEAQQGNGAATCPAGSWPEPGDWQSPILAMEEGDTLRLTFSAPVSEVSYASTTDYPTGLTNPEGTPVPNTDIITPGSATPSANPDVWTAPIPNPLSPRAGSAVPFAVVARDATEYHDYSIRIESPYCVEPGVPLMPGVKICPMHPAQPPPGSHKYQEEGGMSQSSPTMTTPEPQKPRPVIHVMRVRHQGGRRYRLTVFASSPGKLVLTWYQHSHRIARFSRLLTRKRTTFDVLVTARRGHSHLTIDALFQAQHGGAAETMTAFADL
jgi:hypothetical protein